MKKKLLIVHNFYRDFGGEDANIKEEIEFFEKKYDLKLRSDQTLVYNFNKTGEKQRISKAFYFTKELTLL